ncbi:MAG: RlmE family RNA methyltransferase [Deltaproteobacteria bacterium]|nr:RlmE family RNA methyltransferase [Deltaproteobacteria bacterium]MBW2052561.1 RlmE family RNA methyltransferase [Deltaproteobacteria bacterium]MBW2141730.1 RlmE family RNA methyltransferase [Deltaproteobacteria bacterium]MBW2323271.1 RlmE family RNA methyltransferase [Deltaproteobacteria bacterium]
MPKIKDNRRVSDYWSRKAKEERYPARSVYKLKEVNLKYHLLRPGSRVLDLGSAPGGWMMYASESIGPHGLVVGLDLQSVKMKLASNMRFKQTDVLEIEPELLVEYGPFDLIMSDMAPATTGAKDVDQARSLELAVTAFELSQKLLDKGGAFLVKVFEGPDVANFFNDLKQTFKTIRRVKPKSSRQFSPEIFGLGLNFKG